MKNFVLVCALLIGAVFGVNKADAWVYGGGLNYGGYGTVGVGRIGVPWGQAYSPGYSGYIGYAYGSYRDPLYGYRPHYRVYDVQRGFDGRLYLKGYGRTVYGPR